jgi:hypothetical protein
MFCCFSPFWCQSNTQNNSSNDKYDQINDSDTKESSCSFLWFCTSKDSSSLTKENNVKAVPKETSPIMIKAEAVAVKKIDNFSEIQENIRKSCESFIHAFNLFEEHGGDPLEKPNTSESDVHLQKNKLKGLEKQKKRLREDSRRIMEKAFDDLVKIGLNLVKEADISESFDFKKLLVDKIFEQYTEDNDTSQSAPAPSYKSSHKRSFSFSSSSPSMGSASFKEGSQIGSSKDTNFF